MPESEIWAQDSHATAQSQTKELETKARRASTTHLARIHRRDMSQHDEVIVCNKPPHRNVWTHNIVSCEVVLPSHEYHLGMRTRDAVRRQLARDVPRSEVYVCGTRVSTVDPVMRAAHDPRLCTQAVLAAPVEWLLDADIVAVELSQSSAPMRVDIDEAGSVRVRKRLGVRGWDLENSEGRGNVRIDVQANRGVLVVGLRLERAVPG